MKLLGEGVGVGEGEKSPLRRRQVKEALLSLFFFVGAPIHERNDESLDLLKLMHFPSANPKQVEISKVGYGRMA